jgi:sec-independent protein translocase protein TatB
MFDLDVSKMIVVGIVALAVIPPKDLPRVMRTVGQTVGKMRRMAAEFQGQFMEAMREVEREADLDSVKKEFQAISDQAKIDSSFDPVGMVRDDISKAVEPVAGSAATEPPGVGVIAKSETSEPQAAASGSSASAAEIGTSAIALTGSAPAEAPPAPVPAEEAAPEEPPAARRSAAE